MYIILRYKTIIPFTSLEYFITEKVRPKGLKNAWPSENSFSDHKFIKVSAKTSFQDSSAQL